MGLPRTQQALWREIKDSQDVRQVHADGVEEDELEICGLYYGDGRAGGKEVADDPENHGQTWLRQFHAENTLSNPRCVIEARGQEWPADRSWMVEASVNEQAMQFGLKTRLHRCASDYAIRQAQAVCWIKPVPGYEDDEDPPWRCGIDRLAFDEYAHDATALDRELGLWEAHRVSRPIEGVIDEAKRRPELGWNMSALLDLQKQIDMDARKREKVNSKAERRNLVYWVLWERHGKVDASKKARDGYNGCVHYVLDGDMPQGGDGLIRKSEDYFGHPGGPYAIGGAMWVGDLPVALSPLVGTGPQADWVNVCAKALMMAVATAKSNTGVTDPEAARQLREAVNGDVIEFGNNVDIRTLAMAIQTGGLEQQYVVAFQLALESLQRNAGTYQNRQGQVESDATATAILDAQAGYASAMSFWGDGFRAFEAQIFQRWAFWTDLHPKSRTRVGPVPPDVRAQMMQRVGRDPGEFITTMGGQDKRSKWTARDHELMDLSVSVFSGRARNEQTMFADFQFLLVALQSLAALPPQVVMTMDVNAYLRTACRARGNRDLERIVDGPMFQMATMALLQQAGAQTPQQKPTPTAQQPKPAKVIGGGGSRPTQGPASKPVQKSVGAKPAKAGAAA